MAAVEAILACMRINPKGVRFADACRVATHFFGPPRQNGTSHKVWKMPWAGDPRINLQAGDGGKAKPYQVRQLLAAIDLLLSHKPSRARSEAAATSHPARKPRKR